MPQEKLSKKQAKKERAEEEKNGMEKQIAEALKMFQVQMQLQQVQWGGVSPATRLAWPLLRLPRRRPFGPSAAIALKPTPPPLTHLGVVRGVESRGARSSTLLLTVARPHRSPTRRRSCSPASPPPPPPPHLAPGPRSSPWQAAAAPPPHPCRPACPPPATRRPPTSPARWWRRCGRVRIQDTHCA